MDTAKSTSPGGETALKYMLMTFGDRSGLEGKAPDWIREMIDFMRRIDVELETSGELVFQQGLADPSDAKTVRAIEGAPNTTHGPLVTPSRSLAGFWVVDVRDEARAIEIASQISHAADAAIEVRRCMDAPPDEVLEQASGSHAGPSIDGVESDVA